MGIDCTKLRQPCTMDGARVLHAWCSDTPRIGSARTWGREPGRIGKGTQRRRREGGRTLRREAGHQGRCAGAPSMGSTQTVRREPPRIGTGAGTPRKGSASTEDEEPVDDGEGTGTPKAGRARIVHGTPVHLSMGGGTDRYVRRHGMEREAVHPARGTRTRTEGSACTMPGEAGPAGMGSRGHGEERGRSEGREAAPGGTPGWRPSWRRDGRNRARMRTVLQGRGGRRVSDGARRERERRGGYLDRAVRVYLRDTRVEQAALREGGHRHGSHSASVRYQRCVERRLGSARPCP